MNTSRPAQAAPRLPAHETRDELPYGELEDREDYVGLNLSEHTFPSVDGVTFKQVRLKEIDWKGAFLRRLDLTDVWLGAWPRPSCAGPSSRHCRPRACSRA